MVILAVVMRLSFLGLIEFKADEALTVLSLQEWINKPEIIESGLISSTGVKNFPLFQYLLLPAGLISTDPRFLSGLIALVNVVMVGWFYRATRRNYGDKVALVAGLVVAMAPYQILLSRKIWAQDLIMMFAVPIYDLLLRKKVNFWLGLLLMLQAQLHGSGIFFEVAVVTYLGWSKKINRQLIFGLLAGLVPAVPYFISGSFSRPLTPYQIDLTQILMPAKLLSTFSWKEIMGEQDYHNFSSQSPAVGVGIMVSLLTIVGLGVGMWKNKKMAGLIWGLGLVYLIAGVPARLHYYQVVLPWVAVVTGIGLVDLFKKQPMFLKPTVGMMTAGYLLFGGMFAKYLVDNQGVGGDYGIPYRFTVDKVEVVVRPYMDRADMETIRAWAHFDPVMARDTNGAMRHFNLAKYFEMRGEGSLAQMELDRAIKLDDRFSLVSMGENDDKTDKAADN